MAGRELRYPWERLVYPLDSGLPARDRRGWVCGRTASASPAPLGAYQDLPVIVLLGERGVGKSDILAAEAARLLAAGADCTLADLPDLDTPAEAMGTAGTERFVLLDSLDEKLNADPGSWRQLAGCLRGLGAAGRAGLRLRISCRSSRWPTRLRHALEDLWPGAVTYLGVAGLTRADVTMAAELSGLGPSFITEVEQRRLVVPMASWPVTLNPLLWAAAQGRPLPANTVEGFGQACEYLCTETNPAHRDRIAGSHPSAADLLGAARRVAAALQFGADDTLSDTADERAALPITTLARGTEPDGAGRDVACTEHLLLKLTESALLAPHGPRRWGFAHRSFQEFLAARYLQVHRAPAQVRRALLIAGDGPGKHVIAAQREVAAWLALSDDSLFEEILACDPEALLLADMTVRPARDLPRLTEALLDLTREDFTVQLDPQLLYRLDHPGLAGQLVPRLQAGREPNEVYAALMIAIACPQPRLTGPLIALAGDPGLSDSLRSMAVEAAADDTGAAAGLERLLEKAEPGLAGVILSRLWPGHISTEQMLARLPAGGAGGLASSRPFMHWLPERLQPPDLPAALAWAVKAAAGQNRAHAVLAAEILARAAGLSRESGDAPGPGITARFADALIALARSENIDQAGMPLDDLAGQLNASPAFRRAVALDILSRGSAEDIGPLTFAGPVCLFPEDDAGYWAVKAPSLPAGTRGKLLPFPLRNPPGDPREWGPAWELAQADDTVREMTAHWYSLRVDHPRGADARRRRAAQLRDQQRHAQLRLDPEALDARLAALTTNRAPVRQEWARVIIDLHRTAEGAVEAFDYTLDLSSAPGFPQPGSDLHGRLLGAAAAALGNAPVITAGDLDPARAGLLSFPELSALSLLAGSGHPAPGEIGAARWTGLTLALIFAYTASADRPVRNRILAAGLEISGTQVAQALPALLDALGDHQLGGVLERLLPVRTAGITAALRTWAQDPRRTPVQRETALDALAWHGDDETIELLRQAAARPRADRPDGLDPASPDGRQWLSSAVMAVQHDSAASLQAVLAALTAQPRLARPFLERLAADADIGVRSPDLGGTGTRHLGALFELIELYGPGPAVVLYDETGAAIYGTDQQLQRLASQIAAVIAARGTREAAGELAALSRAYPGEWRLRELVRQCARNVAEQAWQPVTVDGLLKLAGDTALRLVRDEHQLREVVTESAGRLQRLVSAPNGWGTLLWHKRTHNAAAGWWPAWEEDLSDFVATFLQHDLAEREVIVNREVQVIRPGLDGQRTDIHVQANPAGTEPDGRPLTVIVECKGCWNDDLAGALSAQLTARYLSVAQGSAGIYLIGYFDSPRWDRTENPGREHAFHALEDLRREQHSLAREEAARTSADVTAIVLDCRLPGRAGQP